MRATDIASAFVWSATREGNDFWRETSREFQLHRSNNNEDHKVITVMEKNDKDDSLKTHFQVQLDKLGRLEIEYHKAIAKATKVKGEIKMCSEALQYQLNKESM